MDNVSRLADAVIEQVCLASRRGRYGAGVGLMSRVSSRPLWSRCGANVSRLVEAVKARQAGPVGAELVALLLVARGPRWSGISRLCNASTMSSILLFASEVFDWQSTIICSFKGTGTGFTQTKNYPDHSDGIINPPLAIGGTEVKESDNLDILIVTYDSKMTFDMHLRSI